MQKKIIVSGANGFTGRYVCLELLKRKITFIALLRPETDSSWFISRSITCRYADLRDPEKLRKEFNNCEILLNIASIGFGSAPSILKACEKAGIKRAVFISTTAIFTRLNASSKIIRKEAEYQIRKSSLNWTILRPTMIFGSSKDRNIIKLIKWIDKYPLLPIFGNGNNLQQPVFVKDIAWSVVEIIDNQETFSEDFNLSGSFPITYKNMINIIERKLSKKITKVFISSRIAINLLKIFEFLRIRFFIKSEQIERLNEDKFFSHKKAQKYFGYKPTTFLDAISQEIYEYKKITK